MRSLLHTLFVLFVSCLCLPSPAQTRYSITDLGTLGGVNSRPLGINGAGQIVSKSIGGPPSIMRGSLLPYDSVLLTPR